MGWHPIKCNNQRFNAGSTAYAHAKLKESAFSNASNT